MNEINTKKKEMFMANAKILYGDPTQPIFHWLAFGFCVGGNANFMFRVGSKANFSVFRYQDVGIANVNFRWPKRQWFCVAVEYGNKL